MTTKICTQCRLELASDAFAADRSKKDGRKAHCKECDAAKKKKAYYASSAKARSSRVTHQRYRRWREIAQEQGERWLLEQVQHLKSTGRLTGEAIARATEDERLVAFFREANRTAADTLRTHLGSRLWDRVARPFVPQKEREAAMAESRKRLHERLLATNIVGLEWNPSEGVYEGVVEEPEDMGGLARHLERDMSDRLLRQGPYAPKRKPQIG